MSVALEGVGLWSLPLNLQECWWQAAADFAIGVAPAAVVAVLLQPLLLLLPTSSGAVVVAAAPGLGGADRRSFAEAEATAAAAAPELGPVLVRGPVPALGLDDGVIEAAD